MDLTNKKKQNQHIDYQQPTQSNKCSKFEIWILHYTK